MIIQKIHSKTINFHKYLEKPSTDIILDNQKDDIIEMQTMELSNQYNKETKDTNIVLENISN